jgi:hypothetical protein
LCSLLSVQNIDLLRAQACPPTTISLLLFRMPSRRAPLSSLQNNIIDENAFPGDVIMPNKRASVKVL